LETAIVHALVKQLDAQMETSNGDAGMKVSIARATFTSHMSEAA
jgi:1-deoxy-D-xylulose 5-phosphate reductoisomerase